MSPTLLSYITLDLPTSITILSISAPITAAIVKFKPRSKETGGVSGREFGQLLGEVKAMRQAFERHLDSYENDMRDFRKSLAR